MKKVYSYFISYTGTNKKGTVVGNLQSDTNYKIKDRSHIRMMEKSIAKDNDLDNAVITNFILLSKKFGKLEVKNDKN